MRINADPVPKHCLRVHHILILWINIQLQYGYTKFSYGYTKLETPVPCKNTEVKQLGPRTVSTWMSSNK